MFCVGGKEIEKNAFGIFSFQEIIGKIKEDFTKEDWGGASFLIIIVYWEIEARITRPFFLPLRLSPLFDQ